MRLKIVSHNADLSSASIYDCETGEKIEHVERVEIVLDAKTNTRKAILYMFNPLIDLFDIEGEVRRVVMTAAVNDES